RVYALGFPLSDILGDKLRFSDGAISATYGMNNDKRAFQISVPIQPGSSGGPLFNSSNRVIGIAMSTLSARNLFDRTGVVPQNVNFAVKIDHARSILDEVTDMEVEPYDPRGMSAEELSPAVMLIDADFSDGKRSAPPLSELPAVIVDFSYSHYHDIVHYTFRVFNMRFIDSKTGAVIMSTSYTGESLRSVDRILDNAFKEVAEKMASEIH
ncbi:MAG: trypsin-like peptidase domain-containing protein, partial [Thermodesulfobacteriota bacterium]